MIDKAKQLAIPCPGPNPGVYPPTRLQVPAGAVDTHCHIIGAGDDFPYVQPRFYTPPRATEEEYLAMLDGVGITRGVLIQVSVHGTDNRLMLNALRQHSSRIRGIAVVPLDSPDSEYRLLKDAGVVGLRLNNLFGGGIGFERLEEYDALAQELGWHLQFFTKVEDLYAMRARVAKLKSTLVVDHMGYPSTTGGVNTKNFQNLIGLVRDGAWVKLSGGYRISQTGPPYKDTIPFAQALVEAGAARCVWGSDWPHVAHWGHMMSVGELLDLLADWVPDVGLQHQVLVDNACLLYGFDAPVEKKGPAGGGGGNPG